MGSAHAPRIAMVLHSIIRSLMKHYELFGARGVFRRAMAVFGNHGFTVPEGAYIRLGTTYVAPYEQVFIKKEYELPLVSSPALIVDAGANVGMASVYFALRYPGACIIALELDGANVRALMENARRFQNI